MKKAFLISESTVYKNSEGRTIARGGGEVYMHNLAKLLLKLGLSVTVFGIKEFDGQNSEEEIEGVLYKRSNVKSRKSFGLLRYLREARKMVQDYDLIFVNQFVPHLVLRYVEGKKKIAIIHDVYTRKGLKFWIRQYGIFAGWMGWTVEKMQLSFDRKYADFILTVSDSSRRKIVEIMGCGISDKLRICPSIVYKRDDLGVVLKEEIILFVGRFVDYKHPEQVLNVLKKLQEGNPKYKAVFVVSRMEKKIMRLFEKVRKNLGIRVEDVLIKRNLNNEEVVDLMMKAKILVHPSLVEGQGIIILESLSLGTPILAYDLPAYKGMLVHGENCELAPEGKVDELCSGAVRLLKNYEFYQGNCGNELKEFSEDRVMEVLKEIIG